MKKSALRNIVLCMGLFCGSAMPVMAQDAAPINREALIAAYQAQSWESAVSIAEQLLVNEPENLDYLNIYTVAQVSLGNYDKAHDAALKVKTLNPEDNAVYANLCVIESNIPGSDVIKTCMEATKRVTDNDALFYLAGQELEKAERPTDALDMYEKAYQLDPKSIVYLTAMTEILFSKGENAKALELTEKGMQNGIESPILYLNAIVAANRAGIYEKAASIAEAGYEKYKDFTMLAGRAEALTALARYDEAIKLWNQVEAVSKSNEIMMARVLVGMTKCKLALSCSREQQKTCSTEAAHECCQHEAEALQYAQALEANADAKKRDNDHSVYLGMAQILANQLENAEKTLAAGGTEITKDNAWRVTVEAIGLYQFSDDRDRELGLKQLDIAQKVCAGDMNCIKHTPWPPRFSEIIADMEAAGTEKAAKAKAGKGCGCQIADSAEVPLFASLFLLMSVLSLLALRRKSA